jgi:hypothetical protein
MANNYVSGSFAFRCTVTERDLIVEAVAASHDLAVDLTSDPPSAALLAAFPPLDHAAPWSGFCDAFADPEFPNVGADFDSADDPDEPGCCRAYFARMDNFDPEAIAMLIQRCCPTTLAEGPIGFEWAETCSKPRIGEFGGGWCAIFADRIEFEITGHMLALALAEQSD